MSTVMLVSPYVREAVGAACWNDVPSGVGTGLPAQPTPKYTAFPRQKFEPVTVTDVPPPNGPALGATPVMTGVGEEEVQSGASELRAVISPGQTADATTTSRHRTSRVTRQFCLSLIPGARRL